MSEPQASMLDVRGTALWLRRVGTGVPVLFLHGARGLVGWPPFFARLAERHEVIAPDHPGYGRSAMPDWLDRVGDLAYFYLDLIDQLGLDGVHLVGHSLGGWTALEIAVRSCAKLKSLTLIDSAGIRIKGQPIANIFIMDREEAARAAFADPALIAAQLAPPSPDEMATIVKNQATTARLGWQPRLFNPDLPKWLHRVSVPTRVIWGERDGIIPPDYAAEFQRLIPQAVVTMVADAAHSPHVEKPDAVLAAMTDVLR